MIKKYTQYIKENKHLDIDPYGEEDWDIDDLPTILQLVRKSGNPYDRIILLDCSYRDLTSLEGIENLISLKRLYCYNNQLTSLKNIENLTNLKLLNCSYNELTSLESIKNLTNLKHLYCDNNQLTNLDGIEDLINLKTLYCQNNQFSEEYKDYLRDYCKKKNIYLSI